MDQPARPPLPWEHKVAIGCLLLLSLQSSHEGFLYLIGKSAAPDHVLTQSAWIILLIVYLSVGIGLLNRSRTAWRFGVILIGIIAGLFLAETMNSIFASLQWQSYLSTVPSGQRGTVRHMSADILEPFPLFWVVARNALLLAVPTVLGLGRIREALKRPASP
jgi:hypothetical protein